MNKELLDKAIGFLKAVDINSIEAIRIEQSKYVDGSEYLEIRIVLISTENVPTKSVGNRPKKNGLFI